MLTDQEIFDKALKNFRERTTRCVHDNRCAYRKLENIDTENLANNACVIGSMTDDECMDQYMKDNFLVSSTTLCENSDASICAGLIDHKDNEQRKSFIHDIQIIHDSKYMFNDRESFMKELAERRHLIYTL